MYADTVTGAMERAISETCRRRAIQDAYNKANGITPTTIKKGVHDIIDIGKATDDVKKTKDGKKLSKSEKNKLIETLTAEMKDAAKRLEFEQAAFLRDKIRELRTEK